MTSYLTAASAVTSDALSVAGAGKSAADYTVLFSILGILVCVGVPLGTILIGKLKYEGSLKQVLWGMAGFFVFTMALSAIMGAVFMPKYLDQAATEFQAAVIVIIKAVCEVCGMFLMFLFTKKKKGLGNALNLGAGYCIAECLVIGFLLVAYLIVITSEDVDSIDAIRELRMYVEGNNLVAGEEWKFIMKAFTAAVFCCLDISVCVVMFIGVQKKMYWFGIICIGMELLIRLPNRLHSFDSWFWGNYAVIIPYLAVMSVLLSVGTYMIWKKLKPSR